MAQKQRRERGGQCQCIERGNRHRKRNRQRELLIQAAGRAGEERDGHEDGDQHERGRDDRAKNLAHRIECRLQRRFLLFLNMPFDILDHHDRVVDNDAGGEHDREQSERVDGKPEQVDERKRADEGDRERQRRDERCTPALEEHEHHENHQPDGFRQRRHDLADRLPDDCRRIEGDPVFHSGRKRPRQALELRSDSVADVERVGGRKRDHGEPKCVYALEPQHAGIRFGAELGGAHVAQADERASSTRLDDDVCEVAALAQPSSGAHAHLVGLAFFRRCVSDAACRDIDVLFAECVHDVAGGQLTRRQPDRVEPQAHRVLALTEHLHVRNPWHALQRILHVDIQVVGEKQRVVFSALRVHADGDDVVVGRLLDGDACLPNLGRQSPERLIHAILHIDGRDVLVACDVESDGEL